MTDKITAGPPPSVDVQDPLPESNFLYRRVFSWAFTLIILGLLGYVIHTLSVAAAGDAPGGVLALAKIALNLIYLVALIVTYYMLAPSAEQMVRMIKMASMFTKGVTTTTRSTAQGPDGAATSTTTVNAVEATSAPAPAPRKTDGTEIME